MMVKKADRPKAISFFIAAVVLSVSLLLTPDEAAARSRVNVSVSLGGVIIVGGAFIVWSVGYSGRFSKRQAGVTELASADGPYTESKAGFVPLYDRGYDTGYSRVYDAGYGMGGDGSLAGEEVRVLPKDAVVIDLLRVEF